MKRLLILLALIALCTPVLAWSNSLNNNDITIYTDFGTFTYVMYPYADTQQVKTTTGFQYVTYPNGSTPSTYFAYDQQSSGAGLFQLLASGGSVFYGSSPAYSNPNGRIELVRTAPSSISVYRDGAHVDTYSIPTTPAMAWSNADTSGTMYTDDPSFGNAQSDTCIVSVQPHNWFILHNYLNANNYGQYDASNNLISNTVMHIKWSIGAQNDGWSISSPPVGRYSIKVQAPSGAIAYNEYINIAAAAHAYGYVSLPQNKTYIGSQPYETGIYWVTLYDGDSVRSTDYFQVLSATTGTTIAWNANTYTASDPATVTYAVDAAYWDTALYDYTIAIKNVYGSTLSSYPITVSSGTQSIDLTGFSQGVKYAQIIITQKTAPTNIGVLASAAMTVNDYVTYNGVVVNAETGTPLVGATVNISQSLASASVATGIDGTFVSANNWLVGSATTIATAKTGYTSDSFTRTPIVARNVSLTIPLIPDPATTAGISIGGIVRDNTYGNPIANATYNVRNSTHAELYSPITNTWGYARVDSLTNLRLYDVWSSAIGYADSALTQKVAVGV